MENPLKILLVEDNEDLGEMEVEALESNLYEVKWVKSIAEFNLVNVKDYFLIISDVSLPDGSGLDLIKRIKMENYETPILIQSGEPTSDIVSQAFELGAISFLSKENWTVADICLLIKRHELAKRWSDKTLALCKKQLNLGISSLR